MIITGHTRKVTSSTFQRDPFVNQYANRWSKGVCLLCEQLAPFVNSKGEPLLHTHYIQWLSEGGADSTENTIALCTNCPDKMHTVNDLSDVQKLKKAKEHFLHINIFLKLNKMKEGCLIKSPNLRPFETASY